MSVFCLLASGFQEGKSAKAEGGAFRETLLGERCAGSRGNTAGSLLSLSEVFHCHCHT